MTEWVPRVGKCSQGQQEVMMRQDRKFVSIGSVWLTKQKGDLEISGEAFFLQ